MRCRTGGPRTPRLPILGRTFVSVGPAEGIKSNQPDSPFVTSLPEIGELLELPRVPQKPVVSGELANVP